MLVAILWGAAASSALFTLVCLIGFLTAGAAASSGAAKQSDVEAYLVGTLIMVVLTGILVACAVYFQHA